MRNGGERKEKRNTLYMSRQGSFFFILVGNGYFSKQNNFSFFFVYSIDFKHKYDLHPLAFTDLFYLCIFSKYVKSFSQIIIFIGSFLILDCSDYYTCQLELYDQLLTKSRPSLRPIDKNSKKITVHLGFSLIRLVSVVCYFVFQRKNNDDFSFRMKKIHY
jgi:hypothetical protein